MDDLITAKRHMEHPHNIKAHGPQVACLGCAYACLFFFFFYYSGTFSTGVETITTGTNTKQLPRLTFT